VLLVGADAAAQPRVPECEKITPRLELPAEPEARVPPVCISPELPTTLWFDSPLVPGSVEVGGRERFADVAPGTRSFTVIPLADLRTGEHFKVEARFADDAAPTSATLELVGHPSGAARRVEVFRHRRTVEDCQRELKEKDARLRQLEAELARVRSEGRHGPSLSGLLAAGVMARDKTGVVARELKKDFSPALHNALTIGDVFLYRSNIPLREGEEASVRVAGSVALTNTDSRPWPPAGAALVARDGTVKELKVWAVEPIPPNKTGVAYVETELTEREVRQPFTLKLWDEGGGRLVTLEGVSFP
jgi:uncharacterized protein (TIGR02268 family)